jgi:hypothetical protein
MRRSNQPAVPIQGLPVEPDELSASESYSAFVKCDTVKP